MVWSWYLGYKLTVTTNFSYGDVGIEMWERLNYYLLKEMMFESR